jgi:hypothetical protein
MQRSTLSNWFGRAAIAWIVSYAPAGWTLLWAEPAVEPTREGYSEPSSASTRIAAPRPASNNARDRRGE